MNNVSLLDCTLRDGGYLNDWKFGRNTIVNIFERLVASKVDFIELGFINEKREYDPDRWNRKCEGSEARECSRN